TALLATTRGDGGQNEIGPELFEAIGILRTEELMAMHRMDGAEQYFTRAYEFGYSFSVEETLEKWGKEEILGDIVRIIRTVRPDVIVSLPLGGEGGGQHHQTSARLTKEAFRAAADPNRFPEQMEAGLRPWQALKYYTRIWFQRRDEPDPPGTVRINTGQYDPVLGRSYFQMGMEGRSRHRCQGMPQLRALPGERFSKWVLEDSVIEVTGPESDLFDGVATGLDRLKDFVKDEAAEADFVLSGLDELQRHADEAKAAFDARRPWRSAGPLWRGLTALRRLRRDMARSSLSKKARYELEHRLAPKERDFVHALALAHGIGFDPIADRGEVTPRGTFEVALQVTNRSPEALEVTGVELALPPGWSRRVEQGPSTGRLELDDKLEVRYQVTVSPQAEYSRPYWRRKPDVDRFDLLKPEYFGLPFSPPAITARLTFRSDDVDATVEKPVQYRYEGPWVGTEKQKEVSVLPELSLTLSPQVVVFPMASQDRSRSISVTALYKGTESAKGTVRLEAPRGWEVSPEQVPLTFQRENEATTVRFQVTPPDDIQPGSFWIDAVGTLAGKDYREGVQTIAYHHIQTRYLFRPARAKVVALDVQVAPVKVGYVMGVGDEVPVAIGQLGAEVMMLERGDLAEGDLSQFDLIMTGIRAYLNRDDLRAYNHRLLEYVKNGGTMVVQYNKFEFDDAQWGPYPAKMSRNRITVEEAPITILDPSHPLFNSPNKITEDDWGGWVQERGLYFLGERDERYVDLLASEDP
ncbi:MAG: NEW3 domain-containing protein, partial [Acidobacteriota bacterium]